MAGWKLRKDKTLTEESGAEAETQGEPVESAENVHTGAILDLGQNDLGHAGSQTYSEPTDLEPDFETDSDLHFEDDSSPLQFTDETHTPLIAAPPPPSEPEPVSEPGEGNFTSTLRMNREELANAFAPQPPTGIPTVAPFVLDSPLIAPATADTPPRLIVRVGRLAGAFDLSQEVTVIGRPDSAIHHYPEVEIDLDDAVSRRHAEVVKRDEGYFLRDAGSTNGTLLNGEKLPAHEERLLSHGDRIRVGERTEIVFE